MGIALISLASAITINSGECEVISLDTTKPLYWTVSGNSSNMDGINITYETFGNYTDVTVCLHPMFQKDSFTLIFLEEQTKEIIIEVPVSSGGSHTKYVDKEVLIEVPNYIDREVEVIKIVETEGETIIKKKVPVWINLVYCIIIILLVYMLFNLARKHTELKRSKEELNNNEQTKSNSNK